jgi:hypothetical protein
MEGRAAPHEEMVFFELVSLLDEKKAGKLGAVIFWSNKTLRVSWASGTFLVPPLATSDSGSPKRQVTRNCAKAVRFAQF